MDMSQMPPEARNLTASLVMSPEAYADLQKQQGALELARAYEIVADLPLDEQGVIAVEANTELRAVKARIAQLEKQEEDFMAPLKQVIANAKGLFAGPLDALRSAETYLKGQLAGYTARLANHEAKVRREREDAERAARQKAAAEAAAARAKGEAEAREKQRQADEAAAAQARALAEGDAKAAREAAQREAKLREQAQAATENGESQAQQVALAASSSAPSAPRPEAPKLDGFSTRKTWAADLAPNHTEETALAAIVGAIAGVDPKELKRRDLLALVARNEQACNALAKALKDSMSVPGLVACQRVAAASRSK